VLDGGAVFGVGQCEVGSACFPLGRILDGFAGGVVEVAELLTAQARTAAAEAAEMDVAALMTASGNGGFLCGHGYPLPRGFWLKIFKRLGLGPDLPRESRPEAKSAK